jgi:DNA-directed RNA polymerase III subunit RPC11
MVPPGSRPRRRAATSSVEDEEMDVKPAQYEEPEEEEGYASSMRFCVNDGNLLLLDIGDHGLHYFCQTCPYIYSITQRQSVNKETERKVVDDVLGGDDAWDNVDQTEALCPECSNKAAYFMMIQIRSADEPTTIFYKCTKCGHRWNE